MKKYMYLFALLIFAAIGLSSCTDDTEDLKKQIAELQQALSSVKGDVNGLKDNKPETVDISGLEADIATIQAKLAQLENIETPEGIDLSGILLDISKLQKDFKDLKDAKPETVDLSKIEKDIADIQAKLALLENIETPEDADLSSLTLALSKLIENLKQNPNYYWDANFAERLKSSVTGQENKHDYVDLGLPSKTLWATCNIGAENPEDYGNYYAWGETEPKEIYDDESYKFREEKERDGHTYLGFSKYNDDDNLTELELADDVAYVKWGGNWRMPSEKQMQELIDNCEFYWKESMPRGYFIESKKNKNVLFMPAAGLRNDGDLGSAGSDGYYWSRSLDHSSAGCFGFYSGGVYVDIHNRYYGLTVRAVCLPVSE